MTSLMTFFPFYPSNSYQDQLSHTIMLSIFANCFLTRSDQHHPNLLIILCKFIDECVQLRLVLRIHPSSPFIHTIIIIIIITANWSYLILRATNDSQEFFDHFGP